MLSDIENIKNARARILVVDDENVNRRVIERAFGRQYDVVGATNGREALSILARQPFDLVLLDVMMPEMDGYTTLTIIRDTPSMKDLPVIMLTALSDNSDIIHGLELGANDYITKPIALDVLHARVATQIKMKRLMDANKAALEALQELQEVRLRFFRVAAHDLKAPLVNIRMAQHILRDYVVDDPMAHEMLQIIDTTVDTMQDIVSNFLDASVLQSGQLELNFDEVNVENLIWEVAAQFHGAAQNKQITLDIGDVPGLIYADASRVKQLIGNLVSNAIKYSPPQSLVRIWSEEGRDGVRIYVADSGPGIPENEQHMLFKQFSKLSTRPTAGESSTGLGLWIVQQLTAVHNGKVGFECPPEGGSIFWVELPSLAAAEDEAPQANVAAAQAS
ncbi:MAG: hybrid sensor histidine kinase/response regulator [Chloroflexi bacterium]|nr:MAG: hybrid sensor histidine kinase/response regulator [Chloroflexota bacterium]